jgi:hypothetical protein
MAAEKVILYFNSHTDALRFALAAGSVMSGETEGRATDGLICETQRASRIILGTTEAADRPCDPELLLQKLDTPASRLD